jgi:hypothetical protein
MARVEALTLFQFFHVAFHTILATTHLHYAVLKFLAGT